MTPHDSASDARAYLGLGLAIRSIAPPEKAEGARAAAGVVIHRNNVRAAFARALRDTFPVVHRLVGEEFFGYLAHEYFHNDPPSSPLVSRYGDRLPVFLESFEAAAGLPYLPDLARLELAWLGAYHAAEADVLDPGEFLQSLMSDPDAARITLHPSVRLVESPFPIHAIWEHNRAQSTEKLTLPASGEQVIVKRPAQNVITETVRRPVFTAIRALSEGRPFGEALAAAMEEESAGSAAELVQSIAMMNIAAAVRHAV